MIRDLRVVRRIVLAATLVAMAATPGVAVDNPWPTVVSCPIEDYYYSNALTAQVTQVGALFHYEYTLYFYQTDLFDMPLDHFIVGNPGNLQFTDAGNHVELGGVPIQGFDINPTWNVESQTYSVTWQSGSVPVGAIAEFWYDSPYSYTAVRVTQGGGLDAEGETLGMMVPEPPSMVPDPSSLAVLGVGLAGIGGIGLRRLRRSARS